MAIDTTEKPIGSLKQSEKLDRFRDWLRLSQEADSEQRIRERDDLLFQVGENQWSDAAKAERAGRPMLSISLLHQPMQLVQNQAAQAELGVTLTPVNETADDELAEIKQGLYQRIQRDGQADQARLWAFDRAKQCGRGWYRVITRYDEDSSNPSDQEIAYERILYQEMVYPDPAATKPDFSDGRFCFVAAYMTNEAFRSAYPKAKNYSKSDFSDILDDAPEWVREKDNAILVAECFYKVTKPEEVELDAEDGPYRRQKEKTEVWRAVLTGCEIIEDEPCHDGRTTLIPIIPCIGRELQPVDGKRRWEGMVRPARDGQQTFNYAISSMVEDISRLSKVPYIGVEGQFEGWEKQWDQINRRNMPYIQYRNVTLGDKPAPPPSPMQIDGTKMNLSLLLAQESKSLVQVATAVHEPSLGEMNPGDKGQSGRAILALQQQADAGTGNYLGNLGSITLPYEARVVLELIPIIYDRPGRVTQVLAGEDETKTVMLNAPFVTDPKGMPMPAQPGPALPGMPPQLPQGAKNYDLTKGKYSIAVNIGKSAQTRLEQGANELGQIIQSDPAAMMPVIGDIYLRYRDFPGSKEAADRLAELREQVHPGLGKTKEGGPTPEAIQAENQALKQQVQQMQAQLQEAAEAIKTDQAKQQATLQKAQMDAQAKAQAAETQATAALSKSQMEQAAEMAREKFQAAHEVAMLEMQQRFQMELERFKATFQGAHEVAMAHAGGRTTTMTRDHGQEMGEEREDEQSQGASEGTERSAERRPRENTESES